MSGFQGLVADFVGGDDADIVMVALADGAESSPGDVRSDTKRLALQAQGFHADADGTICIVSPKGREKIFTVVAGAYYPYRFVQIKATGTTLTAAQIGLLFMPY